MNTINDSAKTQSELMFKGGRCDHRTPRFPSNSIVERGCYDLPFFKNPCEPKTSNEGLQAIVEQFTSLLQSIFTILDNTIQGLLGMVKEPAQEPPTPAETPAPAETAPPAAGPAAPATPEASTPAPSEPEARERKEGEPLAKTGEFLWKPVSDKDGKLAIVLPGDLTGRVKSVKIVAADGKVLGKGDYSGTGNALSNGEREHYRFDKEGKKFPDGSVVEITMKNGNVKRVKIKETSERFTR